MQTPFPFEALLTFGTLSVFLLVGIVMRAKIGFFQRFLIPSCLIGGVIGLILMNTGLMETPVEMLEAVAYHFFNISFISVGFLFIAEVQSQNDDQSKADINLKSILRGSLWMAIVQGVNLPAQAIIGCLVVLLFGLFGFNIFPTFGLLAPLGFNEGPGQALSFGKAWEGLGFEHAATIGLTFGAVGFLFAFFVGVPLVNWGIRKTRSAGGETSLPAALLKGVVPRDQEKESAGRLTMHSGNIETLAFQTALIGVVYLLTYGFIVLLSRAMDATSAKTLWGFFFFFGMLIAMIIGGVMRKVGVAHTIDPGIQQRITGWSIDFLIVATIMAIKMAIVWQFAGPIALISILCGITTTVLMVYFGNRLDAHNIERMVAMFGVCTGTVSSGLLLLRISDPNFRSPVALEVGVMNILALPFVGGSMVLVNAYFYWNWGLGLVMLSFLGIMVVSLLLLKVLKYWGPPKL
ncbi:MAG: hypothetical protein GY866_39170 [Proteobacteria bacterium]|nr:hypothetical protein [Pseudomonadota bacterium]